MEEIIKQLEKLSGMVEKSVKATEEIETIKKTLSEKEKSLTLSEFEDYKKSVEKDLAEKVANLEKEIAKNIKSNAVTTEDGKKEIGEKFIKAILSSKTSEVLGSEMKALTDGQNITNDTDGGYLVPEVLSEQIQKTITNEIAPLLSLAKRFGMAKNLTIPIRTTTPTARREGEGDASEDSKSQFSEVKLVSERISTRISATWEFLNFTLPTAQNLILEDVAEAFAGKYLYELINGDATNKQMEGILVNTDVLANAVESENIGSIAYEDFVNMESKVKIGNRKNLAYIMDKRTLGEVRKLQDGAGNYIFQAGTGTIPNTINSIPVYETGDVYIWNGTANASTRVMPAIAEGAYPIVLCDMSGYAYGNSSELFFILDTMTGAVNNTTYWNFHAYNNGKVVITEKFVPLLIQSTP